MPIDPEIKAIFDELRSTRGKPPERLPVAQARAGLDAVVAMFNRGGVETVARSEDLQIAGPGGPIALRASYPKAEAPIGALVYYHGGGWVLGGLESHDGVCRGLANASGCVVVAVDYRLAPEHKFPAAAEDCYAATRWVAENAAKLGYPGGRMAVGGDSAGGNLALVVSMMARDRGGPGIRFQLPIYPVTDAAMDTASYREFWKSGGGYYFLSGETMAWFWNHYLARAEDGENPYASPARAKDLSNLPPALIVTVEFDPLRDEGEAMAEKLRQAGVPTVLKRYGSSTHAVINMAPIVNQGRRIILEMGTAVRDALTG